MSDDLSLRIARLALGPDDVLVVKANGHISDIIARRIVDRVKADIGQEVRLLVIDKSIDLAVLTRADIESRVSPPKTEDGA